MKQYFKRGLFDRYDGWRVRNVDAVYNVIPFIMRTRMDSQNLFEENMPLEPVEAFIRAHREDMPDHLHACAHGGHGAHDRGKALPEPVRGME